MKGVVNSFRVSIECNLRATICECKRPIQMRWTAPTTGIAMCPIPTALEERRESAVGYKQTFSRPKSTSAVPPKADIPTTLADFRL